MQNLTNWIKQHQVATFFFMVYGIAWLGMFLVYFVFPGNEIVEVLSMPFVLFSPALTAMLISGIAEPRPKHQDSKPRWIAFLLSWLVAAPIMVLHAKNNLGIESIPAFIIFGSMAVFPA